MKKINNPVSFLDYLNNHMVDSYLALAGEQAALEKSFLEFCTEHFYNDKNFLKYIS